MNSIILIFCCVLITDCCGCSEGLDFSAPLNSTYIASKNELDVSITKFIKNSSDFSLKGNVGATLLFCTIKFDDFEGLQMLIDYIDVCNVDLKAVKVLIELDAIVHSSIIWEAVCEGHYDIVKYFIELGVDINSKSGWNNQTLLIAAIKNDYFLIAEYLLDKGANIDEKCCEFQWTPLHLAACWDKTSFVQLLLKRGAKINEKDIRGFSPLDVSKGLSRKLLYEKGGTRMTRYKFSCE